MGIFGEQELQRIAIHLGTKFRKIRGQYILNFPVEKKGRFIEEIQK